MAKRSKIHANNSDSARGVLRAAICGLLNVATVDANDAPGLARVSCRACLAKMRRGAAPTRARGPVLLNAPSSSTLATDLHVALNMAPGDVAAVGGFTPRLTHESWSASCKSGLYRRCGECEICTFERSAIVFAAVDAWSVRHQVARPADGPRWESVTDALIALVEFERTGRSVRSALGEILARAQRGEQGTTARDARHVATSASIAANDLVHVEAAIRNAYADGCEGVPLVTCARILLERFAVEGTQTMEALAARHGVDEAAVRRLLLQGRAHVQAELEARGMLPPLRVRRARGPVGSSTWCDPDARTEQSAPAATIFEGAAQ